MVKQVLKGMSLTKSKWVAIFNFDFEFLVIVGECSNAYAQPKHNLRDKQIRMFRRHSIIPHVWSV
jgi:hypothetical protein